MGESVVIVLCDPGSDVGGQLRKAINVMEDLVLQPFEDIGDFLFSESNPACSCVVLDADFEGGRDFFNPNLQFDASALPPLLLLCNEGGRVEDVVPDTWPGLVDVLFKPVNSSLLQQRLRILIELHKSQVKLQRCQQELESKSLEIEVLNQELLEKNYRLELLSSLDSLTGLFNTYYFDENLQKEWKQAVRQKEPLSLLFINVDALKLYNAQYGHELGDELLRELASVLHGTLMRPVDIVARYGGDQFAAILPETDGAGAKIVAIRMRESVAGLQKEHVRAAELGRVSVSIGGATIRPTTSDTVSGLIDRAARALKEAKAVGRNSLLLKD